MPGCIDPVWERIFRSQEWGKYPPEYVVRFVAQHFYGVEDRSRIRLLDLGCGPGACSWFIAREGFSLCGIDGSPTAISRARERLLSEALQSDLRIGDFSELPWPEGCFDGVVDNAAIYSVPLGIARKTIAEVYRVLKPGGYFLSASFSDQTWGYGKGSMVEPGGFTGIKEGPLAGKGFSRFSSRSQIQDLFSGFQMISLEKASYTVDNMSHMIELWIATCQKPGVAI